MYLRRLSETHIFSPTLLNSARLSFSRTNFTFSDYTAQSVRTPTLLAGSTQLGSVSLAGYSGFGFNGAAGPPPPYHIQNIKTFSDDLFLSRGKHGFRFGTLINQYNQGVGAPLFTIGSISYGSLANFLQGIPTTYSALVPGSNNQRYWTYETLGFYAQDDWRATPRLTLNLGVRYEFMTTPQELNNLSYALRNIAVDASATQGPIMRNRTFLNFSPRAGFAWDVFGNSHTSIRGGAGHLLRCRKSRRAIPSQRGRNAAACVFVYDQQSDQRTQSSVFLFRSIPRVSVIARP